jgi:hypothetical protein
VHLAQGVPITDRMRIVNGQIAELRPYYDPYSFTRRASGARLQDRRERSRQARPSNPKNVMFRTTPHFC